MLAAIFNNTDEWTIDCFLGGRENDQEVEDDDEIEDEEDEEDDEEDGKTGKQKMPEESGDIFRDEDENLSIAECF